MTKRTLNFSLRARARVIIDRKFYKTRAQFLSKSGIKKFASDLYLRLRKIGLVHQEPIFTIFFFTKISIKLWQTLGNSWVERETPIPKEIQSISQFQKPNWS